MSLAAAEASWHLRGDGQEDVYAAMAKENLANLELRLTSLEYTVKTNDQRWKDRGDGFRQPVNPNAALDASNEEYQGGLEDRLRGLQKEQTAWLKRDNWTE